MKILVACDVANPLCGPRGAAAVYGPQKGASPEDLLMLDDRSIQLVLRDVDQKDLALALRGTTPEVRDRVLANMSARAAEVLTEEMELMPPQRRRLVEEAQSRVVAVVRKLEDADEIIISRGGEEDEVV